MAINLNFPQMANKGLDKAASAIQRTRAAGKIAGVPVGKQTAFKDNLLIRNRRLIEAMQADGKTDNEIANAIEDLDVTKRLVLKVLLQHR